MFLAAVSVNTACSRQGKPAARKEPRQADTVAAPGLELPSGWLDIGADEDFLVMMPYADTRNFTGKKIYDCPRCLLRNEVAGALIAANCVALAEGYKIVLYDCYRPRPYQQKMYDVVSDKRYVADPAKGSMHNRGCAVDVGLADSKNNLLDMGTGFDDFSKKADYFFIGLTAGQKKNRTLLRTLMTAAGFEPYDREWWHFTYKKKDYPLSDYIWPCD